MKNDDVLKTLKFKAKKGGWYVKETLVELESNCHEFKDGQKIEDGWGLFNGWTSELPYEGFRGILPRWDGETCPYSEFDIFYEFEDGDYIQVNTLTFEEVNLIINKRKVEKIFKEVAATGMVSLTWAMKNILGMSENEIKIRLKKGD